MKVLIAVISVVISLELYSCSCSPYEYDFYKNIGPATDVGMFRIDTVWYDSLYQIHKANLTVLKTYQLDEFVDSSLTFTGGNGVNCDIGFGVNWFKDTIIAIVQYSTYDSSYHITIFGPGYCGTPYIIVHNHGHNGRDLNQIDALIYQHLTFVDEHEDLASFIWPNPFQDQLNFRNIPGELRLIEIYNVLGHRVFSFIPEEENFSTDLDQLKPGVYYCLLGEGVNRKRIRVIKQ